jgi:hypothetical protein
MKEATFMTVEEEQAHTEMLKDLSTACYVGEDGAMAVIAPNKRKALSLFKDETRRNVGEWEARELKAAYVVRAWAHIATVEEVNDHGDEWSWYIHYKPQKGFNFVKVYTYRV